MKKKRKQTNKKTYISITLLSILSLILLISIISIYQKYSPEEIFFSPPQTYTGSQYINDTYIFEGNPENVIEENSQDIYVGKIASEEFRTLFKFDVSSIPENVYIIDSKLNFTIPSQTCSIRLNISRITSNWNQEEVSWNNKESQAPWNNPGGEFSEEIIDSILISSGGTYTIDLTSTLDYWYKNPSQNFGIIIYPAENSECLVTIKSTQAQENIPSLLIQHVSSLTPEIGSVSSNSESLANAKSVGENITFTATWTDSDDSTTNLFVCNTSDISISGCKEREFCSSQNQQNPASCQYKVENIDNRTMKYYAGICDLESCSVSQEKTFYMNHPSNALIINPNGGETIPTGTTSYIIRFNVSDKNKDSMTANIYLGPIDNPTQNLIAENIALTYPFCTDKDNDKSTPNNCSYNWDPSSIWQDLSYMNIYVNDGYITSNDSSDGPFNIRALDDAFEPIITKTYIQPEFYSGQEITINASARDDDSSIKRIWALINTSTLTEINLSLYQGDSSNGNFSGNFTGITPGTYEMTIYAKDQRDNTASSSKTTFTILKPIISIQEPISNGINLPYSIIRISGKIQPQTQIKGITAMLNVPNDFLFLNETPQYQTIGNINENEEKEVNWFVSSPIQEGDYNLNITYYDSYSNNWTSEEILIKITSSLGGGYFLNVEGYPEVVKGNDYYIEAEFLSSGVLIDADSITATFFDSQGNQYAPIDMQKIDTGKYNSSFTTSSEGMSQVIINATKGQSSYYGQQFFQVIGGLHDLGDIRIISSKNNDIRISISTINKGNAVTDFNLVWNLTKYPSGEMIKEGSLGTFAVQPEETITKDFQTSTDYIGQAKILFTGSYPEPDFENKAYDYAIFTIEPQTTTPPSSPSSPKGGSSGGTNEVSEEIENKSNLEENKTTKLNEENSSNEEKIINEEKINKRQTSINYELIILILLILLIITITTLIFIIYKLYKKQKDYKYLNDNPKKIEENKEKDKITKRIEEIEKKLKE